MTYSHRLIKAKDIPDDQWQHFQEHVRDLFESLPLLEFRDGLDNYTGRPITIYSSDGLNAINDADELFNIKFGITFLSFNGNARADMDYEPLILRNRGKQSVLEQDCKTDNKPYDFFVVAVLMLVDNLCPGSYKISSTGGLDDWQPVQRWLNYALNRQFQLPKRIQ